VASENHTRNLLKIAIAIFDLVGKEHRANVERVLVNYKLRFFSKTSLGIFFGQLATTSRLC
jgi:hypothetical protein